MQRPATKMGRGDDCQRDAEAIWALATSGRLRSLGGGHSSDLLVLDDEAGAPLRVLKRCRGVPTKVVAEAAALDFLASVGFEGVPRVLAHEVSPQRAGLILTWLGGAGSRPLSQASAVDEVQIGAALGRWLARLHELHVPVGGVRFSDDPLPWPDRVRRQSHQGRRQLQRRRELPPETVALVIAGLEEVERGCRELLHEPRPGRFIHRDLRAENVLLDAEGRLAGVVDFERAGAGDPAWEFVKLRWWLLDRRPAMEAPLLEAYASLRPLPDPAIERLYRLFEAATLIAWFGTSHPVYLGQGLLQLEAALEHRPAPRWCHERD